MSWGIGFGTNFTGSWLRQSLDLGLVIVLTFLVLLAVRDRRTLWMVRGLIVLMVAAAIGERFELRLLSFVLDKLVVGAALSMSVVFQSEFRRFLEQLGRGTFGNPSPPDGALALLPIGRSIGLSMPLKNYRNSGSAR